jgi:hypothetical protein
MKVWIFSEKKKQKEEVDINTDFRSGTPDIALPERNYDPSNQFIHIHQFFIYTKIARQGFPDLLAVFYGFTQVGSSGKQNNSTNFKTSAIHLSISGEGNLFLVSIMSNSGQSTGVYFSNTGETVIT